MTPRTDPEEYARAVRAELDDLPAKDRDELLEDLDDHLAEVAAESDVPLEERLGSPAAYAAELRAAYGGRPARPRRSVVGRAGAVPGAVHRRLLGLPPYRQVVAFLPELRPAWWAIRGYALALVVLSAIGRGGVVPGDPVSWVFTLMVIWASVWLGRRTVAGAGSGWRRTPLILANAGAAWAVLVGVAAAGHTGVYETASGSPQPVEVRNVGSFDGGEIYNIVPYAADGTALSDVRLYDQDGRPIILEPEMYGKRIVRSCAGEPPMANSYPLPLESAFDENGNPVLAACDSDTAQPSATPEGSAEPSPESSAGPSPEPSGKPAKKAAEPSARPSERR
ncbi:HAAS signaling domain-containing protein [Microtetraspora malaysiensis]|uniref:HAAS signaling domain-containing protein n=1 Tax=Microtetraspora malaysiensis TaxID=161358 RepID=UPI00082F586F|nr:hypothetical protein [Microtetraspora malaysiensis]